jgi:uncharacterized protein (DUF2141 family)
MKLLIAFLTTVMSASAWAGDINLELYGCLPGKEVRVALYSSSEGFAEDRDGKRAFSELAVKAEGNSVKVSFNNIPGGKYAVAAFVDSNGNHLLDSNFIGKPTEPYGFSRDARNLFSAPSFEQADFEVASGSVTQLIHLE